MQLSDILTQTQIAAMCAVSNAHTDAETYAPSLSGKMRDFLYEFASDNKLKLTTKFWRDVQNEYTPTHSVIVRVVGKQVSVLSVISNRIFARQLGEMLKRGEKLVWLRNYADEICWDNWKNVYEALTSKPDKRIYDHQMSAREMRRYKVDEKRNKMFSECSASIRYHKGAKQWFNKAFEQAKNEWRCEQYQKEIREVVSGARTILASVY